MRLRLLVVAVVLVLHSVTFSAAPVPTTLRGLMVLIDFPNLPGRIPVDRADKIINGVRYKEPSVTKSFRDYWFAQSRKRIVLLHEVVGYYRAPHNWEFYRDTPNFNEDIKGLYKDALDWVAATRPGFDWGALSLANGPMNRNGSEEGTFLAISFMTDAWFQGSGGTHWIDWTAPNGVPTQQVTHATFKAPWDLVDVNLFWLTHEVGHSVWGWPDTYDTTGRSAGTGLYTVMSGNTSLGDIVPVGAPFLVAEGWVRTIDVQRTREFVLKPDGPRIVRYRNPLVSKEYFLIEARKRSTIGNSSFPVDKGLVIWHIDERVTTGNTKPQMTPAEHYMMSIEQADGRFDLEKMVNPADSGDIYIPGRSFTRTTNPRSYWWDGIASKLGVDQIRFDEMGRIVFRTSIFQELPDRPSGTK